VRLGVDVGTVRVGVAISDPAGILASPVDTVPRDGKSGSDLTWIADLVAERSVVEVVVGLPRTMAGHEGPAAGAARKYAHSLERLVHPVPVRLFDERLTSVAANRMLAGRGVSAKKSRRVVDQVAAVEILQGYLDRERGSAQ
jgi:putative Holliday junction resolvase